MRSYICRSCEDSVIVGHPPGLFRRRAKVLLKETSSLLSRVLRRGRIRKYVDAMEERHYMEAHHYRSLPKACPRCGHKGEGDLPWWRPGASFSE